MTTLGNVAVAILLVIDVVVLVALWCRGSFDAE